MSHVLKAKFCHLCGASLEQRKIEAEGGVERTACSRCSYIHYTNPVPVVAAVIEYDHGMLDPNFCC